jgi:hypothetical protein
MRADVSARVAGLVTSPSTKGGRAKRGGRRQETGSLRADVSGQVVGVVTSLSRDDGYTSACRDVH